jgi:hypothetical protein
VLLTRGEAYDEAVARTAAGDAAIIPFVGGQQLQRDGSRREPHQQAHAPVVQVARLRLVTVALLERDENALRSASEKGRSIARNS